MDYQSNKLYYFNVDFKGRTKHFQFKFSTDKPELVGEDSTELNNNHPWDSEEHGPLINLGLCSGDNKIFWVYGQNSLNGGISSSIYYYDLNEKRWMTPTISNRHDFKARHSVSCSYFQDKVNQTHFLYVFGGIAEDTNYINVVEYYKMDFKKNSFEYKLVNKAASEAKIPYIPHRYSCCFQDPTKDSTLFLFAGTRYPFPDSKHTLTEFR